MINRGILLAVALAGGILSGTSARADALIAYYRGTLAMLPAANLVMSFGGSDSAYRDEIHIETVGLVRWITHFHAVSHAEGRFADGGVQPAHYSALYDLHRHRDNQVGLDFVARDGEVIAERNAEDNSHKPPLDEIYRRGVLDPLSALAAIREHLRTNEPKGDDRFTVQIYDDIHRITINVVVVSVGGKDDVVTLRMEFIPVAGFWTRPDASGDRESAPRQVDMTLTHDARLLPLSFATTASGLPVTISLDHLCADLATCGEVKR
jgi:Protein of unknown function (DUF3108)